MIRKPEITKKTSTPTYPPRDPRHARVVEHHEQDRDRPQPLDVGTEPARLGSGGTDPGRRLGACPDQEERPLHVGRDDGQADHRPVRRDPVDEHTADQADDDHQLREEHVGLADPPDRDRKRGGRPGRGGAGGHPLAGPAPEQVSIDVTEPSRGKKKIARANCKSQAR